MLSLVEISINEYKRLDAPASRCEALDQIIAEKNKASQESVIYGDLKRTFYHPSLQITEYASDLLEYLSDDYIQGRHDGSLSALSTIIGLTESYGLPICYFHAFAYQNQNGQMSTFCLNIDFINKFWFLVTCESPFVDVLDLRFHYIDKSSKLSLQTLNKVIKHAGISQLALEYIQDHLNHILNDFDEKNFEKIKDSLKVQFSSKFGLKNVDQAIFESKLLNLSYTVQEINQKLWKIDTDVMPSPKKRKKRRREILSDFERTLVHPSLEVPRDIYERWKNSNITYVQGMINGSSMVQKTDLTVCSYEFRLNFIYQNEDGNYASFAFYLDLVNQKCFLACNHNPLQDYDKQTSLTLFPLEKDPHHNLRRVIKNPQIEAATKNLLGKIPEMIALASSVEAHEPDGELKLKIKALEDIFKYEFGLKASQYHDAGSGFFQYQPVEQPIKTIDMILSPQKSVLEKVAMPFTFLFGLFMALIQLIYNMLRWNDSEPSQSYPASRP